MGDFLHQGDVVELGFVGVVLIGTDDTDGANGNLGTKRNRDLRNEAPGRYCCHMVLTAVINKFVSYSPLTKTILNDFH